MLQRAASNAYSWWWASHIRTKQSKWLEQSLQDMEDRVETVLKLIEEDGDSFAKRAEMYYKKRPELISFVEETYRAYRSLAERYDRISTELQNANSTIASVFPERVQFAMDDEEDYNNPPPHFPKNIPPPSMANNSNIPKVPTTPTRLKGLLTTATRTLKIQKSPKAESKSKSKNVPKSGLSKSEAIEEIDRLQKEILALQTVKEFVKSSYESGLKKHLEIENQISELQGKVFSLQDEFKVEKVIEDDEARTLMAEAALKSCQETLANLHEKQEISSEKAKAEGERIDNAREKLKFLKKKLLPNHQEEEEKINDKETAKIEKEEISEVEVLENKKIEEVGSKGPLTVPELVEKIDDLVTEVINLETAVSSQIALVDRLRTDMDDLQAQVRALEGDKVMLNDNKDFLTDKLREMEEKLNELQKLNQNVEKENKNLKTHFVGAHSSHDFLSEKLYSVKLDEEATPKAGEEILEKLVKLEYLKPEIGTNKDKQVIGISVDNQTENEEDGKVLKQKDLELAATKEEDKQDHNIPVDNQIEKEKVPKQENSSSAVTKEDEKVVAIIIDNQKKKGEEEQVSKREGLKSASITVNDTTSEDNQREKEEEKASQIVINNEKDTASSQKQQVTNAADEDNKDGAKKQDEIVKNEPGEVVKDKDDEMNWQEMLLNGLEDREKVLLTEYTCILRNYKEVKKKLSDVEKKNEDGIFELTLQLREQKIAISRRDQEIQSLRQKLNLLQENPEEIKDLEEDASSPQNEEVVKWMLMDQSRSISPIEERLRTEIDALLDQNLDFWLRFSTSFHQIQKYRSSYQDLQAEIEKVKEKGKSNRESSMHNDIRSELRPIYRHLTEIQTELTVWIEQSASLKEELQQRFSSLCNIQEEITIALKTGAEEEEMRFTSHEAAKFQGEVVNMKQENNKVRDELEAGLEHVNRLQHEIKKTVADLIDELGLSGQRTSPSIFGHSGSRSRVPLRSFIFGTKVKKKSIFRR